MPRGVRKKIDPDEKCPHCGVSLRGEEIPVEDRWAYGGATHGSRKIGIIEYDRVARWRCPDCGGEWR